MSANNTRIPAYVLLYASGIATLHTRSSGLASRPYINVFIIHFVINFAHYAIVWLTRWLLRDNVITTEVSLMMS